MPKVKITALGCYTPPNVLTTKDLEKLVETNDQWTHIQTNGMDGYVPTGSLEK